MDLLVYKISMQRMLTVLMVLTLLSFGAVTSFADETAPIAAPAEISLPGTGAQFDPFRIATCEDLQKVNDDLNASYILVSDIDCSNSESMNDDAGFTPIGDFTGPYFDGRNHAINNIVVSSSEGNVLALFKSIGEDSKLRNVKLASPTITNANLTDSQSIITDSLVGINNGTVENVFSTDSRLYAQGTIGMLVGDNAGTINSAKTASGVLVADSTVQNIIGGLVGHNSGTIANASTDTTLQSYNQTNPICGGIVGLSDGGSITHVFAQSFLDCNGSSAILGGIVGQTTQAEFSIIESISVSNFFDGGNSFDGGIIGNNLSESDLVDNIYEVQKAGVDFCDSQGTTNCERLYTDGLEDNYYNTQYNYSILNQWSNAAWDTNVDGGYPALNTLNLTPLSATGLINDYSDGNDLHLSWKEVYDGTVDFYNIESSIDDGQTWQFIEVGYHDGYTVRDTDPVQIYKFRITPVNYVGEGYVSDVLIVGLAPTPITQISLIKAEARSLKVGWVDESSAPSVASGYNIQYRLAGTTDWSPTMYFRFPATQTNIQNLSLSTEYEFRVQSFNGRGHTEFSEPMTASTVIVETHDIDSCEDLQNMNEDVFGIHKLTKDIDCSDTVNWNGGKGFLPVGEFDHPFEGELDGQGFTISNLNVVRSDQPGGLFGFATGATIKNLKFDGGVIDHTEATDIDMSAVDDPTGNINKLPLAGSLVGLGSDLTIDNIQTNVPVYTNRVLGVSGGLVGALFPNNLFNLGDRSTYASSITNIALNNDVEGYVAGGVIGATLPSFMLLGTTTVENLENAKINISDINRTGDVTCTQACAGGIALSAITTTITNFENSGNVTADLNLDLNTSAIPLNCSFQSAGGIVGAQLKFPLIIDKSSNSGNISSTSIGTTTSCNGYEGVAQGIGGVIGTFLGPVDGAFAFVLGDYKTNTFGQKKLTILDTTNSGNINTNVPYYSGGLAGFIFGDAVLDNTSSSGNVNSSALADPMFDLRVNYVATGGLVGKIMGGGEVVPTEEGMPFVTVKNAQISNSHATGNVYSKNISGGFIGSLPGLTDISKSYATGDVTGTIAGGFIGGSASSALDVLGIVGSTNIINTFSTSAVNAREDSEMLTIAGGYMGFSLFLGELNIENSYSSGPVRVENNSPNNRSVFGGFAGAVFNVSGIADLVPEEYASMAGQFGITLHSGLKFNNIFSASSIPPSSDLSGTLPYFASKEDVSPGITSGAMFGITLGMNLADFTVTSPSTYVTNSFFDESKVGDNKCGYTANNFMSEENPVFPTLTNYEASVCNPSSTNSFKGSKTQAPLNAWDFDNVWHKHPNSYPTFTPEAIDAGDEPDNPTILPPTTEPPKVSIPVFDDITTDNIIEIAKVVSAATEDPGSNISADNIAKVLDTPSIAKALSESDAVSKPRATIEAQKPVGLLAGVFNWFVKYIKLMFAILFGGLVLFYAARKRNKNQEPETGEIDQIDGGLEDTPSEYVPDYKPESGMYSYSNVGTPLPGEQIDRTWDGPPEPPEAPPGGETKDTS